MKTNQTHQQDEIDNIPNIVISKIHYQCMLFPSIVMLCIAILCFTNIVPIGESLFVVTLLFIYPLIFAIQGAIAFHTRASHTLTLGASLFTYTLIMILFLNDTGLIHVVIYALTYMIGFVIASLFQHFKVR